MNRPPIEMLTLDAAIRTHGDQVRAVKIDQVRVGEVMHPSGGIEETVWVSAHVLLRPDPQWVNVQITAVRPEPPCE